MEEVVTKEFLEKHFKFHNKIVLYQGDMPLTITKAWHLHFSGGHSDFDLQDCEDLANLCKERGIKLEPYEISEE